MYRFFVAYDQIMEDMKENPEKDQDILMNCHRTLVTLVVS